MIQFVTVSRGGHFHLSPLSGYLKDIAHLYMMRLTKTLRTRLFKPTARKRRALDGLWRSWKNALGWKRDYALLRENTDLPSYYCREINWKIKEGADAPVGIPKAPSLDPTHSIFTPPLNYG